VQIGQSATLGYDRREVAVVEEQVSFAIPELVHNGLFVVEEE
jgi:hypothetical protein